MSPYTGTVLISYAQHGVERASLSGVSAIVLKSGVWFSFGSGGWHADFERSFRHVACRVGA